VDAAHPRQLTGPLPKIGRDSGKWKTAIALDASELERQARLIDGYLGCKQLPLAFGLMREWIISWYMHGKGVSGGWLGYDKRKPYERTLGALAAFISPQNRPVGEQPTPDQHAFGEFWNQLGELRNAFHHHGMRECVVESQDRRLKSVTAFWNKLRSGDRSMPELGGGGGRSLITPQGSRPGVMYSALKATAPARCLAVCSPLSESSLEEATARAGFAGETTKLIIQDPFSGFGELEELVKQARRWLLDADEIVANLTGGTTLMGIAVQQLVEAAERFDRPCRRFALIDRRLSAEQEQDPYVAGECQWLDGESTGDANGDD
jgi:CRISPR-associated (Cas) DxTHG family